jgi:hypothetical protein
MQVVIDGATELSAFVWGDDNKGDEGVKNKVGGRVQME